MKFILFILLSLCTGFFSFSQADTSFFRKLKTLDTLNVLKSDTLPAPNDVLTEKIKILRSEKNGFDIESILKMQINEQQQKDTLHTQAYYGKLLSEVTDGSTGKLIENCLINLYRKTFTEQEIDDLTAFYKTSAGKKLNKEYIILMAESAKDTEQLLQIAIKNIQ